MPGGGTRRMAGNRFGNRKNRAAAVEPMEPRLLLTVAFNSPVTSQLSTTSAATVGIVVGDVNGDHISDLITAREDQTIETFPGSATGTLTPGPIFESGGLILAAADFNKDGKLDLVTASGVLPGKGDGTFSAPTSTLTLPANPFNVLTADINGDGNPDIIAGFLLAAGGGQPANLSVAVLLGNGDGTFKAFVTSTLGTQSSNGFTSTTFAAGDFNKDGKLDIVSPFGVSLGNGDGTFRTPLALPAGAIPAPAPSGPPGGTAAGPQLFAVGDFNGDGVADVATAQALTSASGVTVLLGKGDGTFTANAPAALGATAPITALSALDVDGDGHLDLLVGTAPARSGTSPGSGGSLLVLGGNRDGTFGAPTTVTTTAAPVALASGDFNADSKPDVVALVGAVTGSVNGLLPGTAADVLLNSSTAPTGGTGGTGGNGGNGSGASTGTAASTVTLTAAPNTAPFGTPVQLVARVTGSGAPIPTGTVTFMDGSAAVGTAPLTSGKATLAVTSLGFGVHSLTASYNGDATYAVATSAAASETVLVTTARVPFLTFALGKPTLTNPFISGDRGTIPVFVQNLGGGVANGSVSFRFYLTRNGTIDSSAIPLGLRATYSHVIRLNRAQSEMFDVPFSASGTTAGPYVIAAQMVPARRFSSSQITTGVATSSTQVQAAGSVFGTVGRHSHLTFTATDSSGNHAVLSISGPGMGTVTQRGGAPTVSVSGTSGGSVLHIATGTGGFSFGSISVSGPLARFDAPGATVTNGLSIDGGAARVALGGGGAMSLTIGNGSPVSLTFGSMNGVTLQSAAVVRNLTASAWIGGAIIAPQIDHLSISGAMSASVFVHNGGGIHTIGIGSITGGIWAVPGGFTTLRVAGDVSGAQIYAGADAGADNVLETSDDIYKRAAIGTIQVGGNVTASTIAAGAAPATGTNLQAGIVLLPSSSIFHIKIAGMLSPDSRILARPLPSRALIAGASVATASDPRFHP